MITNDVVEIVKERLVAEYEPCEIYLFGSYAWGQPDDSSDLDILIVVSEYKENPHTMIVNGHRALRGLKISKDILLLLRETFEEKSKHPSTLCYKVKKDGIKIYARI